jgi:hypothetical protein
MRIRLVPQRPLRALFRRAFVLLLALASLAACGATSRGGTGDATSLPEGWPSTLLVGEGSGPALFLGPGERAAAVGYVSSGVRVRLAGAFEGTRVPIRIDGPVKVRAWLDTSRLAGRVQRRGRLRGAPIALGVNELVGVRGATEDGQMRVEVRPRFGRTPEPEVGPFTGSYPAAGVGPDAVAEAADSAANAATGGARARLPAGRAVALYARPRGPVVATIPPLARGLPVEVARRRGEWAAVRVGTGPRLVAWFHGALEAADPNDVPVPPAAAPQTARNTGLPRALTHDAALPLWRVRARARVRFDGRVIARLADRGWARELRRTPDGLVDVFLAVDDDVALRGLVRARDLEPVEPGALPSETEAGATAQPPADAPLGTR